MYYTWISKKQIGVIFSNWKRGNIELSEEQIKWLYNSRAEVIGLNNNMNLEDVLKRVKSAIESIFSGNIKEAEDAVKSAYTLYNAIYA